jgi:amidase
MQPLCTGNVPQGLLGIETANNLFGRAEVVPGFAVGGSSGGDCALVREGAVPFAVISDMAGSVRIPAAVNGVFGFKPTGKRISRVGRIGPTGH